MAMSSALTPLRALLSLRSKTLEINKDIRSRWAFIRQYRSKPDVVHTRRHSPPETINKAHPDYLHAKNLLYNTLSRSVGLSNVSQYLKFSCTDGEVKRATVTLLWPVRIETEGFGSRKQEAERNAAAAALQKLCELGVYAPGKRRQEAGMLRMKDRQTSLCDNEEENHLQSLPIQKKTQKDRAHGLVEEDSRLSEALAIFPRPRTLLGSVIQVATSSCRVRDLLQYKTSGGKVKVCELNVLWPTPMTFTASGRRRLEAEANAAALACLKLKELNLLDEQNKPLTHARYHQDQVREAGERHRQPCRMQIPEQLELRIQQYLSQYPVEAEVQKLWDEEEHQSSSISTAADDYDEDEFITDAITSKPYRALEPKEAEHLSQRLLSMWKRVGPARGAELPVDAHKESILEAVRSSQVVVISGETGCGKTTRIPRFLLEDGVLRGEGAECNVLVTQPRRISAVSVAQRVAHEIGPALQHCVGYQVRLESRPPERSGGALLFLTLGVLLKKLQSNPRLEGISHVIVDEVHERDVQTDLLLHLLRCVLSLRPELKVLLMSASGDSQRLAQYFGGCPVLRVPGFMHPVRARFLEDMQLDSRRPLLDMGSTQWSAEKEENNVTPDLDLVADVIDHIHRTGEPGAVLCFLPGWQEIKAVQQQLEEKQAYRSGSQIILPLHSSMAVSEQQVVFQRPPAGQRKIVLATNIAETSITIDDIVHVVDAGVQKEQNYDPRTKVSALNTVWISQANVTQRRGRAGRCQPGHSYHLFPRKQLERMEPFPVPEILRTPLESVVMQAKIHCPESKAEDFLSQVLDSPDTQAVRTAVKNLMDIGVLDASEDLTPLGHHVSCMSCDPRLGKVLVFSALFSCVQPVLSVVACLTRDPFYNSLQNRTLVSKAKAELSGSSGSDYLVFSRVVQSWREQHSRDSRQDYLDKHTLSGASLRFIHGLMQQFSDNLCEAGLVDHSAECLRLSSPVNQQSKEEQLITAVLLAGLYPNLIQVKKGVVTKSGRFRAENVSFRTESGPVLLHRSSVNRDKQHLWSRWLTFFSAVKSSGQVFIRDSTVVHPLALLLLTDCDLSERVVGDRVEVALPGPALIRWEFSPAVWELLWDLRASIQAMIYRKLRQSECKSSSEQRKDSELIDLLVDLLNNTDPDVSRDQEDALNSSNTENAEADSC
ncbi:ATP-dependent RNA helicase DHX30 isoform X2 [Danio rerio]|uniref:ATP-dependent RNA helicase DHX30 n=1 Tax=Danio rerio TaxID=7955 RepID=A0A8M2BIG4_DANRE|nr:putative ATP-dependent RNA helicase DHX30 isoform X2 [Danio rerio]|eukprot:XP_005171140.1 putative ATP-dependent RNA helicase DHX30 isoform X2 [Danio rerio]